MHDQDPIQKSDFWLLFQTLIVNENNYFLSWKVSVALINFSKSEILLA